MQVASWFELAVTRNVILKSFPEESWHGQSLPAGDTGIHLFPGQPRGGRTANLENIYEASDEVLFIFPADTPIEEFTPTPAFPALQYLESVDEGGVAWQAGLRTGDFLIEVGMQCLCHSLGESADSHLGRGHGHGGTTTVSELECSWGRP